MGSIPAETTNYIFFQEKSLQKNSPRLLLLTLKANSIIHSNCSAMITFNQFVVVYRRREGGPEIREVTSNVAATVAMLEAQGCIIIDIIDL